jgi:hypothetical protein
MSKGNQGKEGDVLLVDCEDLIVDSSSEWRLMSSGVAQYPLMTPCSMRESMATSMGSLIGSRFSSIFCAPLGLRAYAQFPVIHLFEMTWDHPGEAVGTREEEGHNS